MNLSKKPPARRQRGTALIVALIALVAMISAGFALFRSVDTVNLAANNYQFVKSAQQGVDLALNDSLLAYMQASPVAALRVMDTNWDNPGVNYYAVQQAQNNDGVPTLMTALSAPSWSGSGPVATGWPGEQIDAGSQQLRRYVIERMCNTTGIAIANNCRVYTFEYDQQCQAVNSGGCSGASAEILPFIRITVRVDGPKNSVAYAQMFVKGQ